MPVRPTIEPHVLGPVAFSFLRGFEIAEHLGRVDHRTGGEHRTSGFYQIARPDEMVSAKVFVAFIKPPGDGKTGDNPTQKIFRFVGSEHCRGGSIEVARALWLVELESTRS